MLSAHRKMKMSMNKPISLENGRSYLKNSSSAEVKPKGPWLRNKIVGTLLLGDGTFWESNRTHGPSSQKNAHNCIHAKFCNSLQNPLWELYLFLFSSATRMKSNLVPGCTHLHLNRINNRLSTFKHLNVCSSLLLVLEPGGDREVKI